MKSFVLAFLLLVQALLAKELPIAAPQIGRDHELRQAVNLYRSGWKESATALAKPLAEKGDKDAWFLLGLLLEEEAPAQLSRGQAMDFAYRRAAAAGHVEAGWRLIITRIGNGEEKAKAAAVQELEAAAAKNDPLALRALGEVRLRGFADGKRDAEKARELWQRAAALGDSPSMLLLAKMAEGAFASGPNADPATAMKCYRQAAEAGNIDATLRLGQLLSASDANEGKQWIEKAISVGAVEGHATLGDLAIAKDKQAARLCYEKGAEAGDSRSMVKLAALLLGDDAEKSDGLRWLERAAALRNADAAARLGRLYVKEQPAKAYPLLLEAAENGVPQAQADLADLYLNGGLGRPDPQAGILWLTEAAKNGKADFAYRLGLLYEQGIGSPINYANAGVLYTMACGKGHAAAAARIAFMAAEGLGTRADPVQAWAYASLAIERGDTSVHDLLTGLNQKLGSAGQEQARAALVKLKGEMSAPNARN